VKGDFLLNLDVGQMTASGFKSGDAALAQENS
jgi:hypothetical protein